MSQIHLIVGPVGAGKSTFARQLAAEHRAIHFNLDDWMTRLFSPDRHDQGVMGWYVERVARCQEQIWSIAQALLAVGTSVVLEIGLVQREERRRFCKRMDASGHPLSIYVLEAVRDVRRERVVRRNRDKGLTFAMEVPLHIFELASDMWQQVDEEESSGRDVHFIFTDV